MKFKIRITNVVASVDLKIPLNLDFIQAHFKDIHEREKFPGLMVSLTKPKAIILLFHSGKCVFTGLQHPDIIEQVLDILLKKLAQVDIFCPEPPTTKISNIVAHGDMQKKLNLDQIILSLPNTIYEPEVFPGVIYKVGINSTSVLLFTNGKLIITGCNSIEQLQSTAKTIAITLKKHKCFLSDTPKELDEFSPFDDSENFDNSDFDN